jgi:ATP-dependent protease HslVU (ClpYQ) peptidase subunit
MTCIVGLKHNGKVYLGGDSAGVARLDITIRKDVKVFAKKGMIIGCTSSYRMIQLLQYKLVVPPDTTNDPHKYMCTTFVDKVIKLFKDNSWAELKNNVQLGGQFLIGYKKRLFKIEDDFQVGESAEDYASCGCGESFALGSLYSSAYIDNPIERLKQSLFAAEHFSGGVRAPFTFLEI